jgi:hypothetical protein
MTNFIPMDVLIASAGLFAILMAMLAQAAV